MFISDFLKNTLESFLKLSYRRYKITNKNLNFLLKYDKDQCQLILRNFYLVNHVHNSYFLLFVDLYDVLDFLHVVKIMKAPNILFLFI